MTRATRPVATAVSTVVVITCHSPRSRRPGLLAPPTISLISWVISAWRAALASRESDLIELSRVVGRRLHRAARGGVLGGSRLEQRVVDTALDVARQQGVEDVLRRRLEVEQRKDLALGRRLLRHLFEAERQQPVVDAPSASSSRRTRCRRCGVRPRRPPPCPSRWPRSAGAATFLASAYVGLVGEARPRLRDLALTEVVVGDTTAADDVRVDLLALGLETLGQLLRGLDGVGVDRRRPDRGRS